LETGEADRWPLETGETLLSLRRQER
jgi:hypothetical protein